MLGLIASVILAAGPVPPTCSDVTTPFIGTICAPADAQRHPALLLLGGSEGGNSMSKLAMVGAQHGYVTASVAYFGVTGLPPTLVNVPVETVGKAVDAIAARDDVDAKHIALLGVSKGGELAMLAASTYPKITAVVPIVPSPFAYMGLGANNVPSGCSWSLNGKTLPCVPPSTDGSAAIGQEFAQHQPITLRPLYDASRNASPALTNAAFFPLQNINGPVLCLGAADDQMWNSQAQCDLAMTYLHAHHHAFNDREVVYPHAGHTFLTAVRGPQSAVLSYPFPGGSMAFGGTAQGDADAATSAWKTIWEFLAQN